MKKTSDIAYIFLKISEIIVRIGIFILALGIIGVVSYLLGYAYLQAVRGNDSANAINNAYWLAKWWPKIPYWYPGQGGGVSFRWGYPMLASLLTAGLSIWKNFDISVSYKIIGFLSVPLTALGMYLFVWFRLRSQAGALLAAIFYMLLPASWVWLYDWGFFALSVAYALFFPPLIFFDIFLEALVKHKVGWKARLSLALAVAFLVLAFIGHPSVFFTSLRFGITYSIIYILLTRKNIRLKTLILAVYPSILLLVLGVLGSLTLNGNFLYYSMKAPAVSSEPVKLSDKDDFIFYYSVPGKSVLGLDKIPVTDSKFTHRNIVVPPVVWGLAIIGLVTSLFLSAKAFGIAVAGLTSLYFIINPSLPFYLKFLRIPMAPYFFDMRPEILMFKMALPIAAAFGVWGIFIIIIKLFTFWIKPKSRILSWFGSNLRGILAGVFAFIIAGGAVIYFSNYPRNIWQADDVRYGPYPFNWRDPFNKYSLKDVCDADANDKNDLCALDPEEGRLLGYLGNACSSIPAENMPQVCEDLKKNPGNAVGVFRNFRESCDGGRAGDKELCILVTRDKTKAGQLLLALLQKPDYWPKPVMSEKFILPYESSLAKFNQEQGNDQFTRIDVSPTMGGVVQGINMKNMASIINVYTVQINLIGANWGLEQQVLFSTNDGRAQTTNDMAKWFGTKYLILNSGLDPVDKYAADPENWKPYPGQDEDKQIIWEFKNSPKLWTLTSGKPSILVIGDKKRHAYDPVFRAAFKGSLPYDDFWITEGSEYVDDYSGSDLNDFDIVLLFGYKYKSLGKMSKLLTKYLQDGGSLFISAGWQYADQMWKAEVTPQFFPVESFTWNDKFSETDTPKLTGKQLEPLNIDGFSPLSWDRKGWGTALPGNLRDWAQPILEINGRPLVVGGTFGKGRVVWSGLNLIGHMNTYNFNQAEMDFMKAVFTYLKTPQVEDLTEKVTATRNYPDKIEFTLNVSEKNPLNFYFRESYFPNWHAYLINKAGRRELKIYRAGPGYKLVRLPDVNSGDRLIFEFKTGFLQILFSAVSLMTFSVLLVYVFIGNNLFRKLLAPFLKTAENIQQKVRTGWDKE